MDKSLDRELSAQSTRYNLSLDFLILEITLAVTVVIAIVVVGIAVGEVQVA